MIYVQLRARVKLAQGETLHVADAANVLGSEKAGHCSLFCPTSPGVYTLDAIAVAKALKKVFPQEDISLIGAEVCYVHRIKARGKDFLRPVRTAAALLILLLGIIAALLLSGLLDALVSRIPFVKEVNRSLGAVFGALEGVLLVLVFVGVVQIVAELGADTSPLNQTVLDKTLLTGPIAQINPIGSFFRSVLSVLTGD